MPKYRGFHQILKFGVPPPLILSVLNLAH